jgi:hypothetical protein
MTAPIEDHEVWDFGPERVTVTTTPEVHAATEALLVAVARWHDASGGYSAREHLEATNRLRDRYRQYRDALDAETF